jgi:hypothetical protein
MPKAAIVRARPSSPVVALPLLFTVPVPPSLNGLFANRTKKGAIGGKRFKGRKITPEYLAWRHEAGYRLNQQRLTPMPGRVAISIVLPDQGRTDLDNMGKAILDLAVAHKLIDGDGRGVVRALHMKWANAYASEVLVTIVRTDA